MLDRFISLLAPHVCLVCRRDGSILCQLCRFDVIEPIPERCYGCRGLSQESKVCLKCRKRTVLEYVWVRTEYEATAHDLVYALKFQRARAAARIIAELIDETLPYLPKDVIVAYIPTATSRVRVRGYDQTKLIAKELARIRDLRHQRLLIRIGQSRQVRSGRAQRASQAARNYVAAPMVPTGSPVLLIDDILTTGATLESAAKVLKNAGIGHVYGAVFAQKH